MKDVIIAILLTSTFGASAVEKGKPQKLITSSTKNTSSIMREILELGPKGKLTINGFGYHNGKTSRWRSRGTYRFDGSVLEIIRGRMRVVPKRRQWFDPEPPDFWPYRYKWIESAEGWVFEPYLEYMTKLDCIYEPNLCQMRCAKDKDEEPLKSCMKSIRRDECSTALPYFCDDKNYRRRMRNLNLPSYHKPKR